MTLFATPEFWVLIAFLLFLGGIGKKAYLALSQTLDNHRQKIAQHLSEAERLHDEALSLLGAYKGKHAEALSQATQILTFAEKEAAAFQMTHLEAFEKFLAQKEKALLDRIALETEEAKSNLRQETLEEALVLVEKILLENPEVRQKITAASLKAVVGART